MDGTAIVYCQGAFATTDGKTAHGLVRRTRRYRVAAVVDASLAGRDAGEFLDGAPKGIPLVRDLAEGLAAARAAGSPATHFVVGIATLGGRVLPPLRAAIEEALRAGLDVDSGLHDFLSEDPEIAPLAARLGRRLRDVRKPRPRSELRAFTGRVSQAKAFRVALLGSDSAIGKRTTAWRLYEAFEALGRKPAFVGTGQTAWMQGAEVSVCMDSLVNDFVAGELEAAVLEAQALNPEVIIVEGQGSLLNPAFPGGFEILAATRPHAIVFQHAPRRLHYDLGLEELVPMDPIERQVMAVELVANRPVAALTLNHEGMSGREEIEAACRELERRMGRPCRDPLVHGMGDIAARLAAMYLD